MEIFTIGVYNSTEKEFFEKLTTLKIDTFCDVRQRRGVRGSKYAFVNSIRLQKRLAELNIQYLYEPGLAPTTEIRNLQKEVDLNLGEQKRDRQQLGKVFILEFSNRIINKFDLTRFNSFLISSGAKKVVFFCVEEFPNACHRSLVANKIRDEFNYEVKHL
ncbi:MAG: hypothetical protein A2W93_09995 [Bacteroidetes bacterium GWF2_43_63]|nr:MAG: hypothetical protein A2W94_02470 [Bacteroidetes bacterium GWE2_42_42]OFY52854.1 MAG: hypothetical protein A2W93_09995 [Bacteroidetes bacterium GWF2_43_63]HBG70060.1 hypothetical protein [Bacteroidales bacterium]HCB62334.1 hypothetical protein [Bacteroidales bacterium]